MPRVDAWDVKKPSRPSRDLGFPRGLEDAYEWGAELGKGGFGVVRLVRSRSSGQEFACKSLTKELHVPDVSEKQQARHVEMIKREVAVLKSLLWTLNVVRLEGVYEDDERVHILMEYCRGGELLRCNRRQIFSEEMVAKIMRAVLRTLAQCHSHNILHRDIKPGNFMFLNKEKGSPIKAVDFGMAVFYDPKELPRTDLGFDGTPWFMAPEVLSSQVVPKSDIWSAGVMAYQLLTGYLPFDDRKHKRAPVLAVIWKAILMEEPSFERKFWYGISDEAVDFVRSLLQKDPANRPTAKQALNHPWVRRGGAKPTQLSETVVQRIQRFGRSSIFKRTVLDMIADELLQKSIRDTPSPDMVDEIWSTSSDHESEPDTSIDDLHEGPPDRQLHTWHGGMAFQSSYSVSTTSPRTHHGGRLWPAIAKKALKAVGNSLVRGKKLFSQQDLNRIASTSVEAWEEKRMLAREALDTSVRRGSLYQDLLDMDASQCPAHEEGDSSDESLPPSPAAYRITPVEGGLRCDLREGDGEGSGDGEPASDSFARYYIASSSLGVPFSDHVAGEASEDEEDPEVGVGNFVLATWPTPRATGTCSWADVFFFDSPELKVKTTELCQHGQSHYMQFLEAQGATPEDTLGVHDSGAAADGVEISKETTQGVALNSPRTPGPFESGGPKSALSESLDREEVGHVLQCLQLNQQGSASVEEVTKGLRQLGYTLEPGEVSSLMKIMAPGNDGTVNLSQFLASQVDWGALQRDSREEWLNGAKQAFDDLDKDADGRIHAQDVLDALQYKLPSAEVDAAVEQAAMEFCADELEMDFEGFVSLLRVDSSDSLVSLDEFDSRIGSHQGPSSHHLSNLATVPEH